MLTCYVNGQCLTVKQPIVAADTIDYITAEFIFRTDEWDGLDKIAVFRQGEVTRTALLVNNRIEPSAHVNLTAGEWELGLIGEGVSGTEIVKRITTELKIISVDRAAPDGGDPFPEYDTEAGEQILAQAIIARNAAQNAQYDAETAEQLARLYSQDALRYANRIENLGVTAHVAPTSTPTVEKTGGTGGQPFTLNFGIPKAEATFPETTNLIKGDGAQGALPAVPSEDYVVPSDLNAYVEKYSDEDVDIITSRDVNIMSGGEINIDSEGGPIRHNGVALVDENGLQNELKKKAEKFVPQRLEDYGYFMEYDDLDYEAGINYILEHYSPSHFGCSVVRNGDFIGRQYDWTYNNKVSFVVHRKATSGKFDNYGIASSVVDRALAESGEYSDTYYYMPFMINTGVNENGVFCEINILPELDRKSFTTGTNPGKQDVPMLALVRQVLDDAESVDDAVYKIQNDYNIIAPSSETLDTEMHFTIADATKTVVVEFVNNEAVIIDEFVDDKPIVTNFYLYGYDGTRASLTPFAMGIERYAKLLGGYSTADTLEGMTELIKSVDYTKAYSTTETPTWYSEFAGIYDRFGTLTKDTPPSGYASILAYTRDLFSDRSRNRGDTWQSVHTCVVDISKKIMYVWFEEGDKRYEFALEKPGDHRAGGDVESVNGQTGEVVLDAGDILTSGNETIEEALDARVKFSNFNENGPVVGEGITLRKIYDPQNERDYLIPEGTYSKPAGGIPASDLASGVLPSYRYDPDQNIYRINDHDISAKYDGNADEIASKYATKTEMNTRYSPTNPPPYPVSSVNGKTGIVTLVPSDLGIGSVFTLKGSKTTYSQLPSTGNVEGDVWYVSSESVGYIWLWDGSAHRWEKLGMDIDLSAYRTASAQDLIDNTQNTAINAKYTKPSDGIPKADLASGVQTSLGKADTALQPSVTGDMDLAATGAVNILSGEDINLDVEHGYALKYNGEEVAVKNDIPIDISELNDDSLHRTVTDAQIQLFETVSQKYTKPTTGIPASDLASAVQTSLGKADNALQASALNPYRTSSAQDTIDNNQNTAINAKYTKPSDGIPKTDLASAVQTSLEKADNALQSVPNTYRIASAQDDIDNAQNTAINAKYTKPSTGIPASDLAPGVIPETSEADGMDVVESIGAASTDEEIPTAKAVYDAVSGKEDKGKITISGVEKTANTHTVTIVTDGVTTTMTLVGVS